MLAENDNGTWVDYVYLNGRPIGRISGGQVQAIHTDQVGRPEAVTDAAHTVVWRARNTPFDRSVTQSSITLNLGFPGQYYDAETGLWHNGYRDYSAGFGRYIESDPIGLAGGVNTYVYVGDSPISHIDPYGLWNISIGGYFPILGPVGPGVSINITGNGFSSWKKTNFTSISFKGGMGIGGGLSIQPEGKEPDPKACSGDNGIGFYAEASGAIGPIGGGYGWDYGATMHIDSNGDPSWSGYGGTGPQSDFGFRAYEGAEISAGVGIQLTHFF